MGHLKHRILCGSDREKIVQSEPSRREYRRVELPEQDDAYPADFRFDAHVCPLMVPTRVVDCRFAIPYRLSDALVKSIRRAISTRRGFGRCIAIPSQYAVSSRSIASMPLR